MKKVLIFGASGQIGRYLIRKLTKNNYTVTAVTRNSHQKAYKLKTQANAGYLNIVQASIFDENKLLNLIQNADICINLIGTLYENNKNNKFEHIHSNFPFLISKLSKESNIKQFIHLSALGIENAVDSKYAISKLKGEQNIKKNFPKAVIFRPSIVYSVDDNFTTNFMSLLSLLPFFPLYYNGKTKFSPIHCSDLTEIIYNAISQNTNALTLECVGPEIISFKEILQRLLKLIDKKRFLIPLPLPVAKLSAIFFQLFPKPIVTLDQIKLLNYDNIPSGKYKTNIDIGFKNLKKFDEEVQKYCYMWKKEGQFSEKK
tara:strand:+ start:515 stop:1459 length:945 start_codon:yes stop_codon:yes gene_type:complete